MGCNVQQDNYIKNCCTLYLKVVKTVDPKSSHHKERKILYLYEIMTLNYCGNYFMICKSNYYAVHLKLTQYCMSIICQ